MLKAWGEVTGSLSDVLTHAAQIKVGAFWFWSLCFGPDVVSIQKQFLVSKMIKWGHVGNYKQLTVIDWQKLLIESNWLQHTDRLSAFTNWTTVLYKPANLSEREGTRWPLYDCEWLNVLLKSVARCTRWPAMPQMDNQLITTVPAVWLQVAVVIVEKIQCHQRVATYLFI